MTDVLEDRGLATAEARFRAAKAASTALATATTGQKNSGLEAVADALLARTAEIIARRTPATSMPPGRTGSRRA